VVSDQYESSSVEILVKLIQGKDNSQCLFLDLAILSLSHRECLGHIVDWALASVFIAMK
jgi:hypothetical protein